MRYNQNIPTLRQSSYLTSITNTHSRSMKPRPDIFYQVIQPLHHILRALPSRASVAPDIPSSDPLLLSFSADLCARPAFVVSIIPFTDVIRDLHFCVCFWVHRARG